MKEEISKMKDITIVLCGQAGQGVQTVEELLTHAFSSAGFNVFSTKEYMSRVRGGMNSTFIRVSDKPVNAYIERVDILACLDSGATDHMKSRIGPATIVIGEKKDFGEAAEVAKSQLDISFMEIAKKIGDKIYSNTVAAGAIIGIVGIDIESGKKALNDIFSEKEEVIKMNILALQEGQNAAEAVCGENKFEFKVGNPEYLKDHIIVKGAEAIGLGALGGGCNFISSYPMSPATGVLVFLAQHALEFGIVAEQAEDEISAINMAIGAWYAGARALVTTSGGGFALMGEGLSLSGMLETPVVIHIAQRPGPATGLPTRTEQGDLELALYSGHGEFPRILLAPGTPEEGCALTAKAFNLADEFQVPVIILTDQYFMDSYYNTGAFDTESLVVEKYIIETNDDYARYQLTENGISPRGIPGFGKGLVCVDSDEHTQAGHITEDLDVRVKMMDKRLKKLDLIREQSLEPNVYGPQDYKNLVICWGSTVNVVREAVTLTDNPDTAVLHFTQIYPLHPTTAELIKKSRKSIVVESNATGQFAKLILLETGISVDHKIFKYDGISFASDKLSGQVSELIKKENTNG